MTSSRSDEQARSTMMATDPGRGLQGMMRFASAQEACSAASTGPAQLHLERVGGKGALQPAAAAAARPRYTDAMAVGWLLAFLRVAHDTTWGMLISCWVLKAI